MMQRIIKRKVDYHGNGAKSVDTMEQEENLPEENKDNFEQPKFDEMDVKNGEDDNDEEFEQGSDGEYENNDIDIDGVSGLADTAKKVNDYKKWNYQDILNWIMTLQDGLYRCYMDDLAKELKEENVRGSDLKYVDRSTMKRWGIKQFGHRNHLFLAIQNLINGERQ